jgi:hypothetical protein
MSEELRNINRQLAEIRTFIEVSDIVNRKQALDILGIQSTTLTNYICNGKILVISRNQAGQCFFSRKQLLGIK